MPDHKWLVIIDDNTYGLIDAAKVLAVPMDVMIRPDDDIEEYIEAHGHEAEPVVPVSDLLDSVRLALEEKVEWLENEAWGEGEVNDIIGIVEDYVANHYGDEGGMVTVTYDSNNSGGYWWLKLSDWQALEAAGWEVEWKEWLGAPAKRATRRAATVQEAIAHWESITGQSAAAAGCNCCGHPHEFSWEDEEGGTHYVWIDLPSSGSLRFS